MSDDGGLRPLFRSKLQSGFHWQSVETGLVGPGTPDSNFGARGVERWIEYKQTSGWKPAIRLEQIGWHLHRKMSGGVSFVAIRRWHDGGPRKGPAVDELWLCQGFFISNLANKGMQDPDIDWLGTWTGGPSRWDWYEIADILTAPKDAKGII